MKFIRLQDQKIINTDFIRESWIDKNNKKKIEIIWASGHTGHIECEGPETATRIFNTIYSQGNQAPNKFDNNRKPFETRSKPQ